MGGRTSGARAREEGGALGVGGAARPRACGGGSRPPDGRGRPSPWRRRLWSQAPRLLGDKATSDGGPRRPGMAAWSPAAAAPLLRGTRRVSTGGDRAALPWTGAALGPRGRPRPRLGNWSTEGGAPGPGPALHFSPSLTGWFVHLVGPTTGTARSVRPGACWGSSRTGWGLRPRGIDT